MRKLQNIHQNVMGLLYICLFTFLFFTTSLNVHAQCVVLPGTISGKVFLDADQDAINKDHDGVSSVLVNLFDQDGTYLNHTVTDVQGNYQFDGLKDDSRYRVEFKFVDDYSSTIYGADSKSSVQYVTAPSCKVDFGLLDKEQIILDNTDFAITCFVQGVGDSNGSMPTVVTMPSDFRSDSPVNMINDKASTGSVWGLAYDQKRNAMFSSTFVKQYAQLLDRHDVIYKNDLNTGTTTTFASLSELGINSGQNLSLEVDDCNYGTFVGKTGLGGLEISRDNELLYVVNIANKSVVVIPTVNPTSENIQEYKITDIKCSSDSEFYPFALKYYNEKLYVGLTCIVPESTNDNDSYIKVLELDTNTGAYEEIFSTNYNKGNWQDHPSNNYTTDHWLTDVDFTKDGNMLIGLTDRTGHRFCNAPNRLDQQYPDILIAYQDEDGQWILENNGVAGDLVGTGQNNGDGPGGGEFFGYDFFPANPTYHNEIALGSFAVVEGTDQVIAAVFDPEYNTYSGGVHKYNTHDGYMLASKELYSNDINSQFGKATGLGEVELMPKKVSIEIGNYVWSDEDHDGIQDPNEKGISDVSLAIYDSKFNLIGKTKTDENGHYVFNDENVTIGKGLNAYSTYYVVLDSWKADEGFMVLEDQSYFLTKSNTGTHTQKDINDSDASLAVSMNPAIDDMPYIQVHTLEGGNNNHSYDFGLFSASNFDLALRKTLVNESTLVRLGENVEFAIEIFNQGEMVARNIEIVDYIPRGMSFVETDKNKGWKVVDGNAYYTIEKDIKPEESIKIFITLLINEGYANDEFINYAEISRAQTEFGTEAKDVDSKADSNVSNDSGGVPFQSTDNQIDDGGTIDEDDHDVAMVRIFDLALTKKIINAKSKYVAGDVVDFEIRVFNQGNVDAKDVKIVDYQSSAFNLASTSVDDWNKTDLGNFVTSIPSIKIGQSKSVIIHMTLNDVPQHLGINYAEILNALTSDDEEGIDIDSYANENQSDDKGGKLFTETNDMISDRTNIDEDDHDVAGIPFDRFDLALMKTIDKKYVKAGEEVEFTIEITNQGTITAGRIQIVDYMPKELTIVPDESWHVDPQDATRHLTMLSTENGKLPQSGLLPGEKVKTTIKATVNQNVEGGRYVNYAEITFAEDAQGANRTNDDFDSTPDKNMLNDNGGIPDSNLDNFMLGDPSVDEDDHDPAAFVVYDSFFTPSCTCLNNSEPGEIGQFYTVFRITGSANSEWRVLNSAGMEMGLNAIDEPPNYGDYTQGTHVVTAPYNSTDAMHEIKQPIDTTVSNYFLEGITFDGQPVSITVTDGTDTLIVSKSACNYSPMEIVGEDVVCQSSLMEYCVNSSLDGPFEWTLPEGGVIEGAADQNCVMVRWNSIDNTNGNSEDSGPFQLYVSSEDSGDCIAADSIGVKVGVPGGELACISNVNLSLGDNCEIEVTPDLVLTHDIEENVVYDITLMDANGSMFPDNIINASDVSTSIIAKVFDPCTGNSCWSTLHIEDETKPTFEIQDTIVGCYAYNELVDPMATDNCSNELTVTQVGQDIIKQVCDGNHTFEITKTYVATDASGNQSDPYKRLIKLSRVNLDSIEFPADHTVMNDNPLYCKDYDLDEKGNPNVSETGIPSLEGIGIYPYQDAYCNMGVTYTDEVSQVSNCVVKVRRKWTVYEWYCDQNLIRNHTQIINIIDRKQPQFEAPQNIEVATNTGECEATVQLPAVVPTDDCSSTFRVDITYSGGFIENSNGANVVLPLGEHIIQYRVYDECLNSTTRNFIVNVVDVTPPVMTCTQNTVISLNVNGDTYAYAESFNNGTVDDCLLDFIQVKRMDDGRACNLDNSFFSDKVSFCCADVNKETQVILRAVDVYGNENFCMVNVIVTDKVAPQISCPQDMTIQCDDPYDPNNLSATFGEATASDNCADLEIVETSSISINSCHEGIIYRTFVTTDGTTAAVCTQRIFIVNSDTFPESNITWPKDYTTDESCNVQGLEPENLNYPYNEPKIVTGSCDNISMTHSDKVYTIPGSNDACFKIIRRWEVMDACNFDENDNPVVYYHDQTIVVVNEIKPQFTTVLKDTTKCIIGSCEEGEITLSASATDDCTPADMLEWTYNIDLNKDGIFDITQSGKGGTITISGTYKLGSHRIFYTFNDLCGNSETKIQNFTLVNCDLPVAYCQDINVAIEPMDTDGDGVADAEMATVPVDAVDNGSYHPCGDSITLAFDSLGLEKEIVFDCSSVGIQIVKLYVITITGNYVTCEVEIDVQDNNDVDICPEFKDCIVWPDTLLNITTCFPNYDPATINSEATVKEDCICDQYEIEFSDTNVSNPDDACIKVEREWKVTFNCSESPVVCTYIQVITIENGEAPKNVVCPSDITVTANTTTCEEFVTIPLPTYDEACTFGVSITNDSDFATSSLGAASGSYPVGVTTFNYFVTNECGLSTSCAVTVTVLDGVTPDCNTQNIQIVLNESGTITIAEDAVNNGSLDNCSGGPLTFDTEPNTFTCDDLGVNTITLTVTDPSGNTSTCSATVTVTDTVAPICNVQSINYTIITVNEFYVLTEENIEQINNGSTDPCGEIVSYTVTPDTFTCADVGVNDVVFTVTDNNGNSSSCETTINIMDLVPPVCNTQDITINVEVDGQTVINANQIDNGSTDPCGVIVSLELDNDTFTCDDLGNNTVVLTVTDNSGNTSTCEAVVTVENANELMCVAENVTIFLDEVGEANLTPEQVGGASMAPCGSDIVLELDNTAFFCNDSQQNPSTVTLTVTDNTTNESITCTAEVTVLDTINPTITCPDNVTFDCDQDLSDPSIFGTVIFTDNCPGSLMTDTTTVDNRNDCGVGTLERTYTVTDVSGNASSCTQIIVIELGTPFQESNITWPVSPLTLDDCTSVDPVVINSRPQLDTSSLNCFNLSISYQDEGNSMDCMTTFERTWTVIDSCQLDGSGSGVFTFLQVININDNRSPIITPPSDTVVAFAPADGCEIQVDLSGYTIEDCNAITTQANNSPFATNNDTLDASGIYPTGLTNVILAATDACGNTGMAEFVVEVRDTFAPITDCEKIQPIIGEDGTVTIVPQDMMVSFSDNCTPNDLIQFRFIEDWTELDQNPFDNPFTTSLTLNCDDVANNPTVTILFFDQSMNFGVCIGPVQVMDPNNVCGNNSPNGIINGHIADRNNGSINGVNMLLTGSIEQGTQTDVNGDYGFNSLDYGLYTLRPEYNDELLNGVSTLDMILIQKHILGLGAIDNPYSLIAADVNNSGTITGTDIVILKKNLLGLQDYFNNNKSFRFVEKDYVFPNFENPFSYEFPESSVFNLINGSVSVDYTAIKIGDVNGTFKTNGAKSEFADTRSNEFEIYVNLNENMTTSDRIEIPVYASRKHTIQGMQLSLDVEGFAIDELKGGTLDVGNEDYAISILDEKMTLVWIGENTEVDAHDVLFTIVLTNKNKGALDLSMISAFEHLVVTENNKVERVILRSNSGDNINQLTSMSLNEPNPWTMETQISYTLEKESDVVFNFYSMDGKLIHSISERGKKGANTLLISKNQIPTTGVIIYEMRADHVILTNRMIKLK